MATQKGRDFERTVCRKLSLWLTGGLHDDVLWRNPIRSVHGAKKAEMQLGDIRATDSCAIPFMDKYLIECKNGYSIKTSHSKKMKARGGG